MKLSAVGNHPRPSDVIAYLPIYPLTYPNTSRHRRLVVPISIEVMWPIGYGTIQNPMEKNSGTTFPGYLVCTS